MSRSVCFPRAVSLFALALLALPLAAQSPEESYYKAYYLQHEKGDVTAALGLYEAVAKSRGASADLRAKAKRMARDCAEELACSDFARLAPANSIFYLELNSPGAQLGGLLDQLGLLADDGANSEASFGVSPRLVEGLLGVRGLAVAITEIDPRRGPTNGVAIIHPGDMDIARGLLETMLPIGGVAVEPIEGHPTYSIEGKALVTITSRLMIASATREPIAAVIARTGDSGSPSLMDNQAVSETLAMRSHDLLFFCLNFEPVMPMVKQMAQAASRRDPELRAAMAFLDIESTSTLSGRAGVDDDGLSFEMALGLKEGHRNLLFNLMRLPALEKRSLEMVPDGAAFFAAGTVNARGDVPPGVTEKDGRPVVTLMDFGREFFANIADVALYVMPEVSRTPAGPMPEMALAMRVNDPERSRAVWQLLLGTAQASTGGGAAPKIQSSGQVEIARYEIEGMPVYLASHGKELVLSPSENAIEASIEARAKGRTVLKDQAFASALEHFADGSVRVGAVNMGRACKIATSFMSQRERREIAPFAKVLRDTSASFGLQQTDRRLAVSGRITGIPDVGPMVHQLIQQEMHGGPRVSAGPSLNEGGLRQKFERLHGDGHHDVARAVAEQIHRQQKAEANELNSFAWALLTEDRYSQRYDDVALAISKTTNESTGWNNWFYLDTYALALFRSGEIDQAIDTERKAVELAGNHPQASGAKEQLERFLATKKKGVVRR